MNPSVVSAVAPGSHRRRFPRLGLAAFALLSLLALPLPSAQSAVDSPPPTASPTPPPATPLSDASVLDVRPIPPGGTDIAPLDLRDAWIMLNQGKPFATLEPLDSSQNGIEVNVTKVPEAWWHVQVKLLTTGAINKDDVLLAVYDLRADNVVSEIGAGAVDFSPQRAKAPWDRLAQFTSNPGKEWKRYYLPFTAEHSFAPGDVQIAFNLGLQVQRVQIANLRLINYGNSVSLTDLPQPKYTYVGREENAPWRAAAQRRIEQYRKSDLTIEVKDAAGAPVPNASITLQQTRSDFGFGTCVTSGLINGTEPDNEKFREILEKYFNRAVFEGEMKWVDWESVAPEDRPAKRENILKAIRWMRDRGIDVRGHNLVWPGWGTRWKYLPEDMRETIKDPEAARQRIKDHIFEVAGFFKGQLVEWDVINEPVTNHALQDVLGRQAMVDWFRWAKEADPNAKLYLNDYCMLSGGALDQGRIEAFYDNVKFLKENGAPIEGIGEQGHFGWVLTPPDRMLRLLDRFAEFGLPIQITEFDVAVTDQKLQADYLRDFYTAAFSHPSVHSIVMWGFWEKRHWMPEAAPWRKDWSMKPAAQVYTDLVTKTWRTNAALTTGSDGKASIRGFHGSYTLEVSLPDGTQQEAKVDLKPGGAVVTVRP